MSEVRSLLVTFAAGALLGGLLVARIWVWHL